MNYSKELEVAKQAAKEAATTIREFVGKTSLDVKLKGKNDLVTDADVKSEKKIIEVIEDAFPNDQILAEESKAKASIPEGRIWIIDPIDGTTNFAHSFPVYCVSIALWENREPKVGLVYEVANDELFTATEGGGAYLNEERIWISQNEDPSSSLIGTGFPYNNLNLVDNYLKLFKRMMEKTHGVRRPGSAAWDLCNVACGRFEGFYEYGLSPWDVAAGVLIIKEAGGVITDWKGEGDWLFGQRIIAGNASVHRFLLNEIRACFEEEELKG
ncbi:MAG: inositol monophosphatase [Gracilimonas sp.]|uniref:inositol monophosphatase family protein n=1 Tax=Gracilimonas TaxID=649462 RepID=UPI001B2A491C|nr:inositol monophosphatase family protein [Gracilimonas sp.]MBO6586589.1 inositol monophosphatase [Gracilimonas sp.]MBO6615246.1 inositol monophosphatase [Gracilimonas sp.]